MLTKSQFVYFLSLYRGVIWHKENGAVGYTKLIVFYLKLTRKLPTILLVHNNNKKENYGFQLFHTSINHHKTNDTKLNAFMLL